ncbi:CHASE domain-containing protein [Leeia oryzae]|uniref:CHASE domain-containing protein n=1 Tax=Leeia oryzae TaxID=356662 RepID=UPI00037D4195|nr:CHASE domain-containing protein [Leeia oryzae]
MKTKRTPLIQLGLILLYFVVARSSLLLAFAETNASPVWPPSGVAMAMLLTFGIRYWPAVAIGALLANLASFQDNAHTLTLAHWLASAGIAAGNTAEALFAAWFIKTYAHTTHRIGSLQAAFILITAILGACLLSAGMGVLSLTTSHLIPISIMPVVFQTWWLGDVSGALLIVPLCLAWCRREQKNRPSALSSFGAFVVYALPVAMAVFIFQSQNASYPLLRFSLFAFMPILAVMAYWLGARGVTFGVLLISMFAVAGTIKGSGPFASANLNDSLILLDVFLILCACVALILTADIHERQQHASLKAGISIRDIAAPWGALLAALCVVFFAWHWVSRETDFRANTNFQNAVHQVEDRIDERMQIYMNSLYGARGILVSQRNVTRQEWHDYVSALALNKMFPGVQGLGFVPHITENTLAALEQSVRHEGFPEFRVFPAGKRKEYAPITFLEPFDERNQRVFGFDLMSEPVRRAALIQARDSGKPALTGRLKLLQYAQTNAQSGVLLFLPVYRPDMPADTVAERRRAIIGYVYSPFRMNDLMQGILGDHFTQMNIELYSGSRADPEQRLFGQPDARLSSNSLRTEVIHPLYGQTWLLKVSTNAAFESQIDRQKAQILFIAGTLTSLLLFTMVRALAFTRERAEHLARVKTEDLTKAHTLLQEQENQFRTLYESTPAMMHSIDAQGLIINTSNLWLEKMGYQRDEVINHASSEFLTPASRQYAKDIVLPAFYQSGMCNSISYQMVKKNGEIIDVLLSATAERDAQGRVIRSLAVIEDVTDKLRADRELAELYAFNAGVLENAASAIISTNPEGIITSFNPAAEKLLGYQASELVHQHSPANFHLGEEVVSRAQEFGQQLGITLEPGFEVFVVKSRRGLPNIHEWTYVHKDGHHIPVLLSVSAICDANDQITGFLGIATDITESKVQENTLKRLSERLSVANLAAENGIWEWSLEDNSLIWDEQMHKLYQTPPDIQQSGLVYDLWHKMVHPDDITLVDAAITSAIEQGTDFNLHFRIILPDGSHRHLQSVATIERNPQGKAIRMVGVNRDITQEMEFNTRLQEAKDAADAANQAKSDFLANMSHEIRTPMNAVIGLSQLLADTPLDPLQLDYLQKIQSSSKNLLGILNDILDYSKIEANKLALENTSLSLPGVLDAAKALFVRDAMSKGISLTMSIADEVPPCIKGDPLRLGQILNNLVGNAIKFTTTGEVTVHVSTLPASEAPLTLRFEIRDTGIGLTDEHIHKLFSPFTQADTSITRKFGGTGLGLSICKRLVALMGGEIGVHSQPGQGSTFWFTIQTEQADASTLVQRLGQTIVASRFAGARILLVEDNATNQLIVANQLKKLGVDVDIANNGLEGVQKVAQHDYQLVLMDLQMPEMDGIEATQVIRKTPKGQHLPIIAITAAAMMKDQLATEAAGMNDHLSKPVETDKLMAVLNRWLPDNAQTQSQPVTQTATARMAPFTLPGLNLQQAVMRLENDWRLLRSILVRFYHDFATAPERLSAYLGHYQTKEAIRLVHTVKGLAQNIGADRLQVVSRELEVALQTDQNADIAAFNRELIAVIEVIAPIANEPAMQPATIVRQVDLNALRPRLAALEDALRKHMSIARKHVQNLQPEFEGTPMAATFEEVAQAVSRLEFDTAIAWLHQLDNA